MTDQKAVAIIISHLILSTSRLSSLLRLPHRCPTSSMPNIATPSHHSLNRGSRGVYGRSDVQVEDWFARRLWISSVVVDHVAYFFRCAGGCPACDVPVVAVEGWFAAERRTVMSVTSPFCSSTRGEEERHTQISSARHNLAPAAYLLLASYPSAFPEIGQVRVDMNPGCRHPFVVPALLSASAALLPRVSPSSSLPPLANTSSILLSILFERSPPTSRSLPMRLRLGSYAPRPWTQRRRRGCLCSLCGAWRCTFVVGRGIPILCLNRRRGGWRIYPGRGEGRWSVRNVRGCWRGLRAYDLED